MAWDPTFPQSSTIISGSPPQFQANWSYIQTTMQVDHFWANAVPANDGHHNVIQMPDQGSDPVLGSTMKLALYAKLQAAQDQPFIENSGGVFQLPWGEYGNTALPASTSPITIVDFTARAPSFGNFIMFDTTITGRFAQCVYKWRGSSLTIAFAQTTGSPWTSLAVDGSGKLLQLVNTSTTTRNAAWQYIGYGVS